MRIGAAVGLLIGLLPTGCLSVYPRLAHVPECDCAAPPDDVHAFRVEVSDTRAGYDQPNHTRMCLTPVPLGADGRVPGQTDLSVETAYQTGDGPLGRSDAHRWHGLRVRLYRQGYQLVERPSGSFDPVNWLPAVGPDEQEKAVDDLFTTWPLGSYYGAVFMGRFSHVAPGRTSAGQRDALLFAAGEYESVAAQVTGIDGKSLAARTRLLDKAARLRDLADREDKPAGRREVTATGAGAATPVPVPSAIPPGSPGQ
jgi:hypothetical protein